MFDGFVPWPDRPAAPDRVAVVTVSYNTCELTALLLWSLRRVLEWEPLEIVVVDNGSKDGSAELLAKIDAGWPAHLT
jgi:dolichyl-phosphate beta-glucosyltransferase